MPRPLRDVRAADLARLLPAALDGTGPAVTVRSGRLADDLARRGPGAVDQVVPDEVAVVVRTSGSTGQPRGVLLTATALTASARASADRLGGTGRWLLALPVDHVAGLQVLVRSVLGGTEPVTLPPGPFTAAAFTAAARTRPGPSCTSLVPTQLARLLDDPAATAALTRFDAVLVGGAALPAGLRDRARTAGVRVVTTYGGTESAGGAVYDGRALPGVTVGVDPDGRVTLAGPVLAAGYLDRPDLDAEAFVTRQGRRAWRTGDLGRVGPDGLLEVLGRADDLLISGGVNVAPAAVERVLTAQPGVRAAVVVGLPDPAWGDAVTAVVVPGDPAPHPADLRAAVADVLGAPAAPQHVVLVDALPTRGGLAKPDRRTARTLAATRLGVPLDPAKAARGPRRRPAPGTDLGGPRPDVPRTPEEATRGTAR